MEELNLIDILNICSAYLEKPNDEKTINDFDEIKQKLIVRQFLPLKQKQLILDKVLQDIRLSNEEIHNYVAAIELSLTFNALLAYANIDADISEFLKEPELYDLLWASGFCDYVLEFCEKDYKRLTDMVYHMLSYENFFELLKVMQGLNGENLAELTKEFKSFKLDTDPKILSALGEIASVNDPLLFTIKNGVEKEAKDALNKTKE